MRLNRMGLPAFEAAFLNRHVEIMRHHYCAVKYFLLFIARHFYPVNSIRHLRNKLRDGTLPVKEHTKVGTDITLPDSGSRRHRSPNYPQIGLKEAIAKVRKIYEADKRAGSRVEVALAHMGFNSKNGASLASLSALKKFGLLEEKEGRLFPTQRAVEILNFPETDERYRRALREAALYPALYSELLDRYKEGLPSDRALRAELIADKGFNPNIVDGLISAFKETLDFAGLPDDDALSSSQESEMKTDAGTESEVAEARNALPAPKVPLPNTAEAHGLLQVKHAAAGKTRSNVWTLSGDFTARLDLIGEPESEDDLEALRDYVDITIKALTRSLKKRDSSSEGVTRNDFNA